MHHHDVHPLRYAQLEAMKKQMEAKMKEHEAAMAGMSDEEKQKVGQGPQQQCASCRLQQHAAGATCAGNLYESFRLALFVVWSGVAWNTACAHAPGNV
jgi:hypothetical protein